MDVTSTGSTPTKAVGTPTKAEQFDQMVSLFGSERQKRAYSASKRNKVEQEALESALASAVSHAQTAVEQSQTEADGNPCVNSPRPKLLIFSVFGMRNIILHVLCLCVFRFRFAAKLWSDAPPQPPGRGPSGRLQHQRW